MYTDASQLYASVKKDYAQARKDRDYPKADAIKHRLKVLRAQFKKL